MTFLSDLWITDPIAVLIRAHFPELNEKTLEGAAFKRLPLTDQQAKREEADAFSQKAQEFSDAEMKVAIAEGKQLFEIRYQKFRAAELAKPFYHRIAAEMDLDHWSRVAYWTIDEAAALSFGKDPRQVTRDKLRGTRQPTRFLEDYEARFDILERARSVRQLSNQTQVMHFIEWVERTRFPMPEQLIEATKAIHGPAVDWKAEYHRIKEQMLYDYGLVPRTDAENIAAKADALEETLPQENAPAKGSSLGTRERDSLLKIVIGMAIKGYAYDPTKSRTSTSAEIANDLAMLGIPLSDDTIRNYLQEARELLPPSETEQNR